MASCCLPICISTSAFLSVVARRILFDLQKKFIIKQDSINFVSRVWLRLLGFLTPMSRHFKMKARVSETANPTCLLSTYRSVWTENWSVSYIHNFPSVSPSLSHAPCRLGRSLWPSSMEEKKEREWNYRRNRQWMKNQEVIRLAHCRYTFAWCI